MKNKTYQGGQFVLFIVILTMMSMMGLLASDIYIPGLHQLSIALNATSHQIQLTIGIYLFGLAFFQLIYGPLSDRFGRKPVLMVGFVIYALASLAAASSVTVTQLIIARFFQSSGACAGLVVGRAVISDLYTKEEAPKIYNIIYPMVAASPAIAPLIGGYLIAFFGWKSTFIFVTLFGVVLTLLSAFYLKESKPMEDVIPINVSTLVKNYLVVILNMNFWRYVIVVCMLYGVWFTFLTQSSFLYSNMGYDIQHIGYFYIPLAISIYFGNFFCKAAGKIWTGEAVFRMGLGIFFLGAVSLLAMVTFFKITSAWQLIVPMTVIAFTNGIILPMGIAFAISLKPKISGSASGMVGFCQIGFSSICASAFGKWFGISTVSMAVEIAVLSIVAIIGYVVMVNLPGCDYCQKTEG